MTSGVLRLSVLVTPGYWKNHEYHRLNVKEYIEEFCGWSALKDLINSIYDQDKKAFFATLFETGGRALEVLTLRSENFTLIPKENALKVSRMRLLKRYRKIESYKEIVDGIEKNRWKTELLNKKRQSFTIPLKEPFAQIVLERVQATTKGDYYLFPSPYKPNKKRMEALLKQHITVDRTGRLPYTWDWAYHFIRKLSDHLDDELKDRLGLKQPFYNGQGDKIAKEIHLWLHWFRSQKASQLVEDYGFEVIDLINYFSWEDDKTALRYAKRGWKGLTRKMNNAEVDYS